MKILLWNPMAATFAARWACILTQLGSIQVAAFPGTKQVLPQYLHSNETVFKERILGFELFHWPCADAKFSSISTGVTIVARRHADDLPQRFFTYCPPSELQGRAGAIVDTGWKNLTLHLCVYLPASGSSTFVAQCDRQLFEWAQQMIECEAWLGEVAKIFTTKEKSNSCWSAGTGVRPLQSVWWSGWAKPPRSFAGGVEDNQHAACLAAIGSADLSRWWM